MKKNKKAVIFTIIRYILLILVGIIFILPTLWLLSTSFKKPTQIYEIPPRWLPDPPTLNNFFECWEALSFGTFYKNTILISVIGVLGTVITSSIVAYGFAKYKSKMSSFMFMLVISTMLLPPQVTMIPTYVLFSKLKWINSILPLVIPQWFAVSAFYIFLLRQFFRSIPNELDEAAKIDGCGSMRYLWQVMVPLSKPVIVTVTIFSLINNWNDFMGQLLYLHSSEKFTIAVGLASFNSKYGTQQMNLLMAASLLAMLPLLILFFFAQKYFVESVTTSGIKG